MRMSPASGRAAGRALVIGAGVSGLTTALCLRRESFAVTVVAERYAPGIASAGAGALSLWPPAGCGHHNDSTYLDRSRKWCMVSHRTFTELSEDPTTGIRIRPAVFYFRRPVQEDARELFKMRESSRLPQFRHDPALIGEHRVNPGSGVVDAYMHLAPVIDTEAYLEWLLSRVRRSGCTIESGRIGSDLSENEQWLRNQYQADVIINCTGMGAMQLTGDCAMYPLRGALFHVRNDGSHIPRITTAHVMAPDDSTGGQNTVFVVPRNDDTLVLGGLVEAGESSISLTYRYQPIRDMVQRCSEFLPMLHGAVPVPDPVRVGVRPARKGDVRLEVEPGTRIIHNYGHGGSGFTLSWGCAEEAAALAAQLA